MPWGRHGRATWSAKATPSISVADGNRPVLIAVKADGSLYFRARSSSAWGSWLRLGAGQWAPGF